MLSDFTLQFLKGTIMSAIIAARQVQMLNTLRQMEAAKRKEAADRCVANWLGLKTQAL